MSRWKWAESRLGGTAYVVLALAISASLAALPGLPGQGEGELIMVHKADSWLQDINAYLDCRDRGGHQWVKQYQWFRYGWRWPWIRIHERCQGCHWVKFRPLRRQT